MTKADHDRLARMMTQLEDPDDRALIARLALRDLRHHPRGDEHRQPEDCLGAELHEAVRVLTYLAAALHPHEKPTAG